LCCRKQLQFQLLEKNNYTTMTLEKYISNKELEKKAFFKKKEYYLNRIKYFTNQKTLLEAEIKKLLLGENSESIGETQNGNESS